MKIEVQVLFVLAMVCVFGCAGDKCADGSCSGDTGDANVSWGMSRLLALEPSDGRIRWGVDFQGEEIALEGLAEGEDQVIVALDDRCWQQKRRFAFDVDKGTEIESIDDSWQVSEGDDICATFVTREVPSMCYADGICTGESRDDEGMLVAVDTATEEEMWRESFFKQSFYCSDGVLVLESFVQVSEEFRVTRISPYNGSVIWIHQQKEEFLFIGADESHLFFLSEQPFALDMSTGDLAWETDIAGWTFMVPKFGEGVYLDGTVYVTRDHFPSSPCEDTD